MRVALEEVDCGSSQAIAAVMGKRDDFSRSLVRRSSQFTVNTEEALPSRYASV